MNRLLSIVLTLLIVADYCYAIPTNSRGEYLVKKLQYVSKQHGDVSFEYIFTYNDENEIVGIEYLTLLKGCESRTLIKRSGNKIERVDYGSDGYKIGNITYEYCVNEDGQILSAADIDHAGGKPWKQQSDFNYDEGMLVHTEWHDYYAKNEHSKFELSDDAFHSRQFYYVDGNIISTLYTHSFSQRDNRWVCSEANPKWENIIYSEIPNKCNLELSSIFMGYPVNYSAGEHFLFLVGWMNLRGWFLLDSFGDVDWNRMKLNYTFDDYGRPIMIQPVPDNKRDYNGSFLFDYVLEYVDE